MNFHAKCVIGVFAVAVIVYLSPTFGARVTDGEAEVDVPPEQRDWHTYISGGETNLDMKMRASEARDALAARIDAILISQKKELDAEAVKLLETNQDAWLVYAKSKAEYMADAYRGGSHSGLEYGYVLVGMHLERVAELKQMHEDRQTP